MLDQAEELLVVVGWITRVKHTVLFNDMVAVELFMEQAVDKVGVDSCFKEGSDKEGSGSNLHIKETQSTWTGGGVQELVTCYTVKKQLPVFSQYFKLFCVYFFNKFQLLLRLKTN